MNEEEAGETLAHEWTKVNGGHLRFDVAGFLFPVKFTFPPPPILGLVCALTIH